MRPQFYVKYQICRQKGSQTVVKQISEGVGISLKRCSELNWVWPSQLFQICRCKNATISMPSNKWLIFLLEKNGWMNIVMNYDLSLWLTGRTVFVLDVGVGSASEQLQGALPLAAVRCWVQRSVTQQVCAVDVWRLLHAELHKTEKDIDDF